MRVVWLRASFVLLAVVLLLLCASCGWKRWFRTGGSTDQLSASTSWQDAIPVPTALPHGATAIAMNAEQGGDGFEDALPNNHCNRVGGSDGEFLPSWWQGQDVSNLAYCIYAFDTGGYVGPMLFTWSWSWLEAGCDITTTWIGVANQGTQTWDFVQGSTNANLTLGPPANYVSAGNQVFILIVAARDKASILDWVRLDEISETYGEKLFFLHHSTGAGLVFAGNMRALIDTYNNAYGTSFQLWDHGYQDDGLTGPDGNPTGTDYGPMTNFTDPPDLHNLWCSPDADWVALRNTILDNYDVIAFKSCFPASTIPDEATLNERKQFYRDMRDFFDTRLDKLFVVMSTPPLRDTETNPTDAANARAFADWLKSPEYLDGHPNVVCFDLFKQLAAPNDGGAGANMLREDYEIVGEETNSHPNATANQTVGPLFADFLCDSALAYWPGI